MYNRSKAASLAIGALLVLTPFLQISPAAGFSDIRNLQILESSLFQLASTSQSSSSSSNQFIEEFLSDWNNFQNLSSMFDRSVVVGFMTSQIKALKASVVSSNLDMGTKQSLVEKLNAAFNKASDASRFILQAQPRQTENMLNASANVLSAFVKQVQALEGKKISQPLATGFISSAQTIVQSSTLRGSSVLSVLSSSDLTLFDTLLHEVLTAEDVVKADIQELVNAGFTVRLVNGSLFLVIATLTSPIGIATVSVLATSTALLITEITRDEMATRGHPLSLEQIAKLFFVNFVVSLAIAAGVVALTPIVPIWLSIIGDALGIALISGIDVVLARYYFGIDQFLANFLGPLFDRELFSLIESVLSPSPVLVRSFAITDATFGRAVVNYYGRSTFFANDRFWIFFWNGASVNFVTSPDGQSWSSPTLVSAASKIEDAPEWSIWFDGTYVHYAIACCSTSPSQGNDIFYRRGVPQADGTIAWSAPEQRLSLNAKYPMLTVDDQGFPWVIYQNTGASFRIDGVKSSTNDGTFVIQTGFPVVINPVCCGLGVSILSPMSGGKMLIESNAACCFNVPLKVQAWTGSSFLPAVTVGTTNGYAQGVSEGDRVHLVFLDGSNNIMDKVYDFATNSIVSSTLVVTGGSGVPVLTRDPSNGNIFVFYTTSNEVLFLKRDGSTGQWSASPTSLVSEPSGFWTVGVTVSYEPYGGRFSLAYVRNTSAPQELMFFPFFG